MGLHLHQTRWELPFCVLSMSIEVQSVAGISQPLIALRSIIWPAVLGCPFCERKWTSTSNWSDLSTAQHCCQGLCSLNRSWGSWRAWGPNLPFLMLRLQFDGNLRIFTLPHLHFRWDNLCSPFTVCPFLDIGVHAHTRIHGLLFGSQMQKNFME